MLFGKPNGLTLTGMGERCGALVRPSKFKNLSARLNESIQIACDCDRPFILRKSLCV